MGKITMKDANLFDAALFFLIGVQNDQESSVHIRMVGKSSLQTSSVRQTKRTGFEKIGKFSPKRNVPTKWNQLHDRARVTQTANPQHLRT